MKIYYNDKKYNKATLCGEKLISFNEVDNRIKSDAYLLIARSSKVSEIKKTLNAYKKLRGSIKNLRGALYFKAMDNFEIKNI